MNRADHRKRSARLLDSPAEHCGLRPVWAERDDGARSASRLSKSSSRVAVRIGEVKQERWPIHDPGSFVPPPSPTRLVARVGPNGPVGNIPNDNAPRRGTLRRPPETSMANAVETIRTVICGRGRRLGRVDHQGLLRTVELGTRPWFSERREKILESNCCAEKRPGPRSP